MELFGSIYLDKYGCSFTYDHVSYSVNLLGKASGEMKIRIGFIKKQKPYFLHLSLKEFRKMIIKAIKNDDD